MKIVITTEVAVNRVGIINDYQNFTILKMYIIQWNIPKKKLYKNEWDREYYRILVKMWFRYGF